MPEDPKVLAAGKVMVAIMWIVTGSTLFIAGDSSLLQAGRLTFWLTVAVHVVECGFFYRTLRTNDSNSPRSLGENILLTMIFGVFHYATLKLEEKSGPGDDSRHMQTD